MPYILKDNIRIYYEYEPASNLIDSTESLVLIHGVGFDLRGWDLIVPYMTTDYNVLRYDFRGHGLTDRGVETLNDKTFVDDLICLLTHLQIDKFHFVAHGAGSVLALFYTDRYPSRVQSSVFVSLPLFNSSDTAHKYTSYRKDLNIHNSIEAIAAHVIPNVTLYPSNSSEMIKLYEAFSKVTIDVYFEILDFYISVHDKIVGIFKENVIPTLLLTGEQDNMFPTFLSSLTASSNPNCRYMTIYNSSNMVFYDQPLESFKQINHFFNNKMEQRIPVDPLLKDLHSNFLDMLNEPKIKNSPTRLEVNLINQFQVFVDNVQIISGWGRRNRLNTLMLDTAPLNQMLS
ncbi:alpha/beta hydrolase [Paenibacillus sp. 19GGS1-52]|uniref:alpha/beta fold hydrolase n=1 Tax=Paenibacillus sp. 19GGS1-52 TaxID=2758563 RepID=UPI001EFA575F|nr:alpha/beta hydrolase [Paenibacillus sp. 19GGS1-52]ULO09926.1 alpha/beta hydrolase [Paenibacillus sp. 19GGS1-52]